MVPLCVPVCLKKFFIVHVEFWEVPLHAFMTVVFKSLCISCLGVTPAVTTTVGTGLFFGQKPTTAPSGQTQPTTSATTTAGVAVTPGSFSFGTLPTG